MLTKQHQLAAKIIHPQKRRAYKAYMCGLCHALGDSYGLPHRLLTSYEMILLNMLTNAQRSTAPEIVMRRCPLNPSRMVSTNQDAGSEFAAAVAVVLARVSLDDHVQDSAGRNIGARLAAWGLRAIRYGYFGAYLRALLGLLRWLPQLGHERARVSRETLERLRRLRRRV